MWWIVGLFAVFAVLVILGACRVSGYASRQEEGRDMDGCEGISETGRET